MYLAGNVERQMVTLQEILSHTENEIIEDIYAVQQARYLILTSGSYNMFQIISDNEAQDTTNKLKLVLFAILGVMLGGIIGVSILLIRQSKNESQS
jgi:uncharacterized protein involved in exopolysaccharide biosynthesis